MSRSQNMAPDHPSSYPGTHITAQHPAPCLARKWRSSHAFCPSAPGTVHEASPTPRRTTGLLDNHLLDRTLLAGGAGAEQLAAHGEERLVLRGIVRGLRGSAGGADHHKCTPPFSAQHSAEQQPTERAAESRRNALVCTPSERGYRRPLEIPSDTVLRFIPRRPNAGVHPSQT